MTRMTAIEMIKNAKESASSPNVILSFEQELRSLRLSLIETARERDEAIKALRACIDWLDSRLPQGDPSLQQLARIAANARAVINL